MGLKKLIGLLGVLAVTGCNPKLPQPSDMDLFAQCLTDNGATLYGTKGCPGCIAQKHLFEESFQYINFIDCDEDWPSCAEAGIHAYPTWQDKEGHSYLGPHELFVLANIFGCEEVFEGIENADGGEE